MWWNKRDMTFRASIAAAVLGTLALLGSFALPAQFETRHAQAMECDSHHGCAPVSPTCVSVCLDALKDEGAAVAVSLTFVSIVLGAFVVLLGRFPLAFSQTRPSFVPIPIRASDIRITRKRLD